MYLYTYIFRIYSYIFFIKRKQELQLNCFGLQIKMSLIIEYKLENLIEILMLYVCMQFFCYCITVCYVI